MDRLPKNIPGGARKDLQESKTPATVVPQSNAEIELLIHRMLFFLENKSWQEADDCCEELLKLNPECAHAYLGKLMAKYHIQDHFKFHESKTRFDKSPNYEKAIKFGDENVRTSLRRSKIEWMYQYAFEELYERGRYDEAMGWFEPIKGYKDVDELHHYCTSMVQTNAAYKKERQERAKEKKPARHMSLKGTPWIVPIASFAVFMLVFQNYDPSNVTSLLPVPIILVSFGFLCHPSNRLDSIAGRLIPYVLVIIETAMSCYLYYYVAEQDVLSTLFLTLVPVWFGCAMINIVFPSDR